MNKGTILTGGISTLITGYGFIQTIDNYKYCLAYIILFGILFIISIFSLKKNRAESLYYSFIAFIILITSIVGLCIDKELEYSDMKWDNYLHSLPESQISILKKKADLGDANSQLALLYEYERCVDYGNALKYAQKAADNGSAEACARLAYYQIFGMGCKADISQGIYNMERAQKMDRYVFDIFLEEMSNKKIALPENDKRRMAQNRKLQLRIVEIERQISDCYNKNKDIDINLIKELERYSLEGYAPATMDLFYIEFFKHPKGSDELSRLVNCLYQSNHIPTHPMARMEFFRILKGGLSSYKIDDMQQIEDNNYFLIGYCLFYNKEISLEYEQHSNTLLLSEYELFREQYKWFNGIVNKTISTDNSPWIFIGEANYSKSLDIARNLLLQIIQSIQARMEVLKPITKDYINTYYFSIDYDTP